MIIVTRPGREGIELTKQLEANGLKAIHQPLFEIKTILNITNLQKKLDELQSGDSIIVVSPQVVSTLKNTYHSLRFPTQVHYFAIGEKTARSLQKHLAQPVVFPYQENSEGLLRLSSLKKVQGKHILILRGTSGREQLFNNLTERGALVSYISCYQRIPIKYQGTLSTRWPKHSIITVTSGECVALLNRLVEQNQRSSFILIAGSKRIADQATAHHWPCVIVSKSTNNQILFKTIRTLCHNGEAEDQTG